MRRIGGGLGVWMLVLAVAGTASAQVKQNDLRLYLDATALSWTKQITEFEGFFATRSADTKVLSTGAFVGGGAGLGYAVLPYLVPQLYLSLQNIQVRDSGDKTTVREWDLRPSVEVPLLPDARVVPFGMAGMTLGRIRATDQVKAFGLGPVLGVGMHAFLTPRASLDASLTFRGTFFVKNDLGDGAKLKQYALLFNLGASFWL